MVGFDVVAGVRCRCGQIEHGNASRCGANRESKYPRAAFLHISSPDLSVQSCALQVTMSHHHDYANTPRRPQHHVAVQAPPNRPSQSRDPNISHPKPRTSNSDPPQTSCVMAIFNQAPQLAAPLIRWALTSLCRPSARNRSCSGQGTGLLSPPHGSRYRFLQCADCRRPRVRLSGQRKSRTPNRDTNQACAPSGNNTTIPLGGTIAFRHTSVAARVVLGVDSVGMLQLARRTPGGWFSVPGGGLAGCGVGGTVWEGG